MQEGGWTLDEYLVASVFKWGGHCQLTLALMISPCQLAEFPPLAVSPHPEFGGPCSLACEVKREYRQRVYESISIFSTTQIPIMFDSYTTDRNIKTLDSTSCITLTCSLSNQVKSDDNSKSQICNSSYSDLNQVLLFFFFSRFSIFSCSLITHQLELSHLLF